ncbi:TraR/DksA C4-type zinc finger protein [Candidatus Daviesbacteria bacterium]|nr:TraR/DksA C4-type zinc finger protein [Candidatus Daviesbacteria bacterium]
MLNFPKKTLEFIKRHLRRQQREVEKNLKEVEEDDPVKSPSLAESSEPGTDSYLADTHAKTIVLGQQLKNAKTSILVALTKIKKGTYGKCEKCGMKIEIGRLMIMPTAQYCIACSKKTLKIRN